jgi:hypothetical protein
VSAGKNTLTLRADTAAADRFFDALVETSEEAVRAAAQAGAQVLYDEVKRNVERIGVQSGNLRRSIYQVFSADNSGPGRAVYHVSWNVNKAPHGHLLEYGHLQRYKHYRGNDGRIRPMVRPGMEGRPKPGRRASQDAKDAYWVPLPGGPRQVAARPFVRPAAAKFPDAQAAMEGEYLRFINEGPLGGRR